MSTEHELTPDMLLDLYRLGISIVIYRPEAVHFHFPDTKPETTQEP
jgi:hypothetical protein